MKENIEHLKLWRVKLKLRKRTTIAHILAGLVIVAAILYFPVLGIILFLGLAFFEYWNWIDEHDTGVADWWECLLGTYIGACIAVILRIMGVI